MRPEPMVNVVKAPPRREPPRPRRAGAGDAELTSRPGCPPPRHARRLGARRYEVKSAALECCCSIKMSPPNCSVKMSPPYGDIHDEQEGSPPGRAGESGLDREDH